MEHSIITRPNVPVRGGIAEVEYEVEYLATPGEQYNSLYGMESPPDPPEVEIQNVTVSSMLIEPVDDPETEVAPVPIDREKIMSDLDQMWNTDDPLPSEDDFAENGTPEQQKDAIDYFYDTLQYDNDVFRKLLDDAGII
jgi:hypothetical protein